MAENKQVKEKEFPLGNSFLRNLIYRILWRDRFVQIRIRIHVYAGRMNDRQVQMVGGAIAGIARKPDHITARYFIAD